MASSDLPWTTPMRLRADLTAGSNRHPEPSSSRPAISLRLLILRRLTIRRARSESQICDAERPRGVEIYGAPTRLVAGDGHRLRNRLQLQGPRIHDSKGGGGDSR